MFGGNVPWISSRHPDLLIDDIFDSFPQHLFPETTAYRYYRENGGGGLFGTSLKAISVIHSFIIKDCRQDGTFALLTTRQQKISI